MKKKKIHFKSICLLLPVNFLIISSCTNDATYSRMDDQPTTSRYTKNFVESLSTKDRTILNTASKTYEELIQWWQEQKIDNPQKCFDYINDIAHSKIADEDKTKLINTLCAVHPKCLERLQNNDRYINPPNYIIRLLNKKVNWESYQKVENIIKALRACTPRKVNFNEKDEHGNTLLMNLDLSKDLRYTNAIDNLYQTKTSILSNKDKAIRKEAKEEYFKNLRFFENKVLCCYECRNHLDEILEAQIEPTLKSKLISALFETYPNYLHGCKNDFNNQAQELANKTMQLLWKNKIQHSGHKRTIVHSLFELGPEKVNFTMKDGDGKNLFMDIAASGDDRYMEECLNTGSDSRFTSKPIIDYRAKDNNGKHVLYYAIDSGNLNVIHRLCEDAKNSGIDIVNTTAKDSHCPVTYALAKHPNHIAYQIVLQLIDCNPKTINFALKQAVRGRHYVKPTSMLLKSSNGDQGFKGSIKTVHNYHTVLIPLIKLVAGMINHSCGFTIDGVSLPATSFGILLSVTLNWNPLQLDASQFRCMQEMAEIYGCQEELRSIREISNLK